MTNQRENMLDRVYQEYHQAQLQILQNNNELKNLTSKIIKSNYDNKLIENLNKKNLQLQEKQRENQQFLRSQKQLERMYLNRIAEQKGIKNNLNKEYMTNLQKKHQQKNEEYKKRIEQQQNILKMNQIQSKIQNEKMIKFNELYRKRAQSDLQQKQLLKLKKKMEQQKQKQLYKQKYENRQYRQNPKKQSYQIFFQQFNGIQNKIQQNYLTNVVKENSKKQLQTLNFINKGIQQSNIKTQQLYQDKIQKQQEVFYQLIQQKRQLSQFLKKQIEDKQQKKHIDKINSYQDSLEQLNALKSVAADVQKHKLYQNNNNKSPYLEKKYSQNDIKKIDKNNQSKLHNPITNPIGFKIGITNPYILKQLEKAKQETTGDRNLILKNLVQVGNSSLQKR